MEKTILLVEDDLDLRQVVRITVEEPGRRLLEASSGTEALEIALAESPDLIVLDWGLPGLTGIEVARRLRENSRTKGIPIIMLTARDQSIEKDQARALGIHDYLIKPFSPLELMDCIDSAL